MPCKACYMAGTYFLMGNVWWATAGYWSISHHKDEWISLCHPKSWMSFSKFLPTPTNPRCVFGIFTHYDQVWLVVGRAIGRAIYPKNKFGYISHVPIKTETQCPHHIHMSQQYPLIPLIEAHINVSPRKQKKPLVFVTRNKAYIRAYSSESWGISLDVSRCISYHRIPSGNYT